MNVIETYSGLSFAPLEPDPELIVIGDIARSLSNQCRFLGHSRFYSVAEHSVRVSRLLEEWGEGPPVILWGLLHDASEAYLGDVPTPIKRTAVYAAYREAEARLMGAICDRYGLSVKEPAAVRKADAVLLATEVRSLKQYSRGHWDCLTEEALFETIVPWTSEKAEREFLNRFASYYGRL